MFERATIFSAIFIFIFFGIVGVKYLSFIKSREQATKISFVVNQKLVTSRRGLKGRNHLFDL